MAYEMKDNVVHDDSDENAAPGSAPEKEAEPEQMFEEAMSRLESITKEWAEAARSV